MNRLYTIALLLLAGSVSAQSVFLEDFNSCSLPTGWTNTAVLGDTVWSFGNNSIGSPAGSVDGSCMAYVHDDDLGGSYPAVIMDLVSPIVDLSALDTAQLQFDYIFEDLGMSYFAVALWNGAAWDTVFTENTDPGCFGFFPTCGPRNASIDLSNYLIADFQMKFIFSDGNAWNWYVGLDNVSIYVPPTVDAVAIAAISPSNGCGLGTETVSFAVYNNGIDAITSVSASYELNATTETETFSVNIASGQTDTLTFSVGADVSVFGTYDFTAWIEVLGDLDAANDTIWFSVINIPVISGLPYSQGFETGAGGWTSGGTANSWELGAPAGTLINSANAGVNAWVTNLDGPYTVSELSYVESPCFDFSSLNIDPVFRFAHIFNTENCCDEGYIEISFDAGTTWSRVGLAGEGENWYDDTFDNDWDGTGAGAGATMWRTAEHLLDNAAGEGSVKIRIVFSSDGSVQNEGFGFDDISIFEQPAVNARLTQILSPVSGCGLGMELVTVVFQNLGDDYLVDFNVEYNAGAGVVTELVSDTLYSGEIDTLTFAVPVDFSVLGAYDFAAWTAVVGDGDLGNDSLFTTVNNIPVLSTLPYLEGFEAGPAGWVAGGTSSTWELGDPQGVFIDTANSGINAWVTNLDGAYATSEQSYIESPCFDFSALTIDPILEFAQIFQTESCCDEGYVDISFNGGTTWARLGVAGEGTNWYNNTFNNWWNGTSGVATQWRNVVHLLDGAAGESSVKIRFGFSSDGSIENEGFGIDDINITEQPAINSELTAIVTPQSGCGLTSTEAIQIHVTNLGSTVMDSVIIGANFDNGIPWTEVFNNSIAIGGDTIFTLSQTIDLSVYGEYELVVWTATVDDGDTSNDTLTVVITSVPTVTSFPYLEDFETGANGWTSGGVNSTWQLGEPEAIFIDTANSGVNAWVTNLTGNYAVDEISYVESPCLDFSSFSEDPILSFAGIFTTEEGWDGGWVDVSLDGGTTWTKLGTAGEGENWYNDAFDDVWTGISGLPNQWLTAEHLLDGTAGEASVKIRFVLNSDFIGTYEGFGLDDIFIRSQPEFDLEMASFDAPGDGCQLGEEAITFTVYNNGLQAVTAFQYGFSVDGSPAQTQTYSGASIASGATATITFATELADLSLEAVYSIDVFVSLVGDEYNGNDTLFGSMVENFGSSTPLSQTNATVTAIPDGSVVGAGSDIFFCGLPPALNGCLEIENVTIDSIAHTWLSDLDIYLVSPAGDTLELSISNGGSGDNMSNVVFSDESINDITLQVNDILPGTYHTQATGGLASFYNGQNPNGGWSLVAYDNFGGDAGSIISWSMTFVDHSPAPQLAYADTTICLTQVLSVSSPMYDSYLWSTGHNSQTAQLFGNVLGLGTHEVFVTVDEQGCSGVSNSFTLTVDACAGVSELGNLTIDVYPNPSNGQVVLDINGDSEGFALTVVDVNGKLVYTENISKVNSSLRKAIDLSLLSKGMYFLKLEDGVESIDRKLIIQ
ncbi:MAG: T9SS type A sorting domain-containing protein [Flavobacteriales bacterium]|nr:T9SS type A sorting domain-containing protein [Flavobacteriales bacterium]